MGGRGFVLLSSFIILIVSLSTLGPAVHSMLGVSGSSPRPAGPSLNPTGTVCLSAPGSTTCPSSPPTISITAGSTVDIAVFVQGSDLFNAYDITLDETTGQLLTPLSVSFTGSVLPPGTIAANCIGVTGTGCSPYTSNVFTIKVAVLGTTFVHGGLLFTATYKSSAGGSTTLGYQINCSLSSVAGTTTCVSIANGRAADAGVPETAQGLFVNVIPSVPINFGGGRPDFRT
jgi:hypothetical protein